MSMEEFICALRETDPYIKVIYSNGGCYKFARFLQKVFPNVEVFIDHKKLHTVAWYEGELYDIDGKIRNRCVYYSMSKEDVIEAERWSFAGRNRLVIQDCPHCGEEILL